MLLYPNMTLLDLVGPQAALGIHGKTFLLARTLDPVTTDTGVSLNPTTTFAECPADLDVIQPSIDHGLALSRTLYQSRSSHQTA